MTIRFADIRRQVETLGIAERFFDSVLLFTLFEAGVFRQLAGGPAALEELAGATGSAPEVLRAVLDGAVATGLLEREAMRYVAPEPLLACLGRPDSAAYLGEWITFLAALVPPLASLPETLRTGRPSGSMIAGERDDAPARAMTAAMDAYARTRGAELATRLDWSGVRRLLDVGCGPATYALAILEQHPAATATLVDLPDPLEVARRAVAERGLSDRVTLAAADALTFVPAVRPDAVLVSNVLHMLGPERGARLVAHCGELLEPGGRLVVQAEFLDDGRTSPRWPALLNLIMQATTEGGRNHSVDETARWLRAAGLERIEHRRLSPWNVNSVLVGWRPGAGRDSL